MRLKTGILFLSIYISPYIWSIEPVTSFTIPSKIEFAGQSVSLERYDMRERFDREQILIAYNHSTSILIVKRANRIFPIIEPILKQNGIPDDFKYLAVIESLLEPRAISPAKAAGIWQMMPDTGKQFGLEVNDEVDERYHIEKATVAACKYLRSAYNKFKSWSTVAASYNAGMGRITDELQKQNADEAFDLWLNTETSRYMFRILAMKQFLENPKAFGFQLRHDDFYPTIRTKSIKVNARIDDLAAWATQYDISYSQLKDFNIWLRDRKLMNVGGKEYMIQVPEKQDLIYSKSKIKIHNPVWAVF